MPRTKNLAVNDENTRNGFNWVVGLISGVVLVFWPHIAKAQQPDTIDNPKVGFVMPFEFDFDFGAPGGNAVITRILPVVSVSLGKGWYFNNLTLALIAFAPGGRPGLPGNPEPVKGERVFGLADWVNASMLFIPTASDRVDVGLGIGLGLPVATSPALGSEKWTAGPALRLGYRPGKWRLNALAVNLWSFAGNRGRSEVNQLVIRALFRRPFGNKNWFFTSNPIITVNWLGDRGQRLLLPLGGGIGKGFSLGNKRGSIAVHFYANLARPEGAPKGLFRLDFLTPFFGSFRGKER